MIISKNSNVYKELRIKELTIENSIMGSDILVVVWMDGTTDRFIPTR